MKLKSIVVIGSSNTDMVAKSTRIPVPGETVLGGTFMMNPGGKGANQAVAAARMGGNVTFITRTGNDLFGKQSKEIYDKENIHTEFITTDTELPSGVALIMVDGNGENCIVVASGANGNLKPADIEKAKHVVEEADIVLLQLEIPMETVEYSAKIAYNNGRKVILNPAPAAAISDELMKCLYAIIPNETEAEILSGIHIDDLDSAQKAADIIGAKGVNVVIITLGSEGSFIKDGKTYAHVPVEKTKAIDTTAAGDTFCGALCVALSEGLSVVDAVKFGNKAARISVTREGAQASIPYRNEIQS